jgi:SAM-dependent methyltransferase
MNPKTLLNYLAEPGTGNEITFITTKTSNGEPFDGWFIDKNHNVVGELRGFKFYFINYEAPGVLNEQEPSVETNPIPKIQIFPSTHNRVIYRGEWSLIETDKKFTTGASVENTATFRSVMKKVDIKLLAHQWSGIASISLNGKLFTEVDLYQSDNGVPRIVTIPNLTGIGEMLIEISPTGRRNASSYDNQLIIESFTEYLSETEMPIFSKVGNLNQGGALFSSKFLAYLAELPSDAIILDVGGGKRQIDDVRYVNLEYSSYEEPDIFADGQNLPFKSNSVDMVYCTGVLEHVKNPFRAAQEIHRVLKPNGILLACIPFLQPVHNEPQHFFNATPYGVRVLFEKFEDPKIWWDGNFLEIVKWIAEAAHIPQTVSHADWQAFLAITGSLSKSVDYERLKFICSAIWIDARK